MKTMDSRIRGLIVETLCHLGRREIERGGIREEVLDRLARFGGGVGEDVRKEL